VVVPAHNEEPTIGGVVSALKGLPVVDEIIIVDNCSVDGTGTIAAAAGAQVIHVPELGFGRAMKAAIAAARNDLIFKLDGDMRNPAPTWLERLLSCLEPGVGLVKAYWDNSEDVMPVTNLVVKPALCLYLPELVHIKMPIAGIYLVRKKLLKVDDMPDDFSFDLDVLVRVARSGQEIAQAYLGNVFDTLKPVLDYVPMATQLLSYIRRQGQVARCTPTMLIMAHPDDAEIWCGGTLVKILSTGAPVRLWIITGTGQRAAEANALTDIYNNLTISLMGVSEFHIRPEGEAVKKIAQSINELRPRLAITHHHGDSHPDHRACFELVSGACFAAERRNLPDTLYMTNSYFQAHRQFAPNTYIDITEEADLKYANIRLHRTQDTDHWVHMAKQMDKLNGAKCGVEFAEAFELLDLYVMPRARDLF